MRRLLRIIPLYYCVLAFVFWVYLPAQVRSIDSCIYTAGVMGHPGLLVHSARPIISLWLWPAIYAFHHLVRNEHSCISQCAPFTTMKVRLGALGKYGRHACGISAMV